MDSSRTRDIARRRKRRDLLRRRATLASALGFAAFLGLAAQHAVGTTKHATAGAAAPPPTAAPTRYFDQQAGGYAFDDGSAAPLPPPVAQTNVS